MKAKRLLKLLVPAVAVTMGVSSCQDYDANFSEDTLIKEKYAEQFAKDFGQIDPNQDWSMAGRYTATVNLGPKVEGVLSVYTKEPGLKGSYLLAKTEVKEGRATVEFDAIKGTDLLYAVIQKDGRNIVASNYDVVNNTITLGNAATRALTTTATEDNVSTTAHTLVIKNKDTGDIIEQTPWRMTKTAVAALVESGLNSYSTLGDYHYYTDLSGANPKVLNPISYENLYKINNNHEESGAEYTMEQLWKVFGKKKDGGSTEFEIEGVFQEGEDHIERYVKPGTLTKDASLVVAEDGPVSMELIWRGTDYYDVFGYFFYPEDGTPITAEYLWSTNKYILFGDDIDRSVGGTSDLTQVNVWNDAMNSGAGAYEGWTDLSGMRAQNVFGSEKTKMRGTKMWLVNFDASGNPTYEFKAGTKLGFFLYTPKLNQIVFSDTKLNYQLNYLTYKAYQTDASGNSLEEDNDQARPFAVTFDYKGSTLLGFADGCNDYDINDVVFGAFNVIPSEDITPDEPEPEAITWMVACEDLGGTFDYDFNDLVFGLRKTPNLDVTKSTLNLIPYAAGGTLEAHVLYDGEDKGEIHAMLGGSNTTDIINAYAGTSPEPGEAITLDKNVNSETSINELAHDHITVKVQSDGASDIFLTKGDSYDGNKAPQMILFSAGWDWPSEGVDIRDVYPDFADWVADTENVDWYKNINTSHGHVTSPLAKPTSGGGSGNSGNNDGGNGDGGDEDTDTRTPMVIGEKYSLTCGSGETHEVHDAWQTWGDKYLFSITSDKKLPSNLPSSATATLTYSWTGGNYYSNADIFDYTYLYLLGATKAESNTSASVTLTKEQLTKLLGGTDGFYVILDNSLTLSSATITINE